MVKEVILYQCISCGNNFRDPNLAKQCCEGGIKSKRGNFKEQITVYKCEKCDMVHGDIKDAEKCTHWSDDEEVLSDEGVVYDENKKGYRLDMERIFKKKGDKNATTDGATASTV